MGKRLFGILEELNDYLEEHGNDSDVAAITLTNGTEFDVDYRHRKKKANLIGTGNVLVKAGHDVEKLFSLGGAAQGHPFGHPLGLPEHYSFGISMPPSYQVNGQVRSTDTEAKTLDASYVQRRHNIENALRALYAGATSHNDIAACQARLIMDDREARDMLLSVLIENLSDDDTAPTPVHARFEDVANALGANSGFEAHDFVADSQIKAEDLPMTTTNQAKDLDDADLTEVLDLAQSRAEGMEPATKGDLAKPENDDLFEDEPAEDLNPYTRVEQAEISVARKKTKSTGF